jgi:hypothetical protein
VNVTVVRDGKERVVPVTLLNLQGGTGVVEAAGQQNNVAFGATLEPLHSRSAEA